MAKESTLKNMMLVLTLICLVSAVALAAVFSVTEKPIAMAEQAKINSTIAEVVPEFDNKPAEEKFEISLDGRTYRVYPAKQNNKTVGYAIETSSSAGFGGRISLMVGYNIDGTIFSSSVISHSETPGLGDKMEASKSPFSQQFKGKNPQQFRMEVKKDGGDVDAITASTITSRAYCDALRQSYKVFEECIKQNK